MKFNTALFIVIFSLILILHSHHSKPDRDLKTSTGEVNKTQEAQKDNFSYPKEPTTLKSKEEVKKNNKANIKTADIDNNLLNKTSTPNERFQLIFNIYDENNLTLETCARIDSDVTDFMRSDEDILELGLQYKPGSDFTLEYEKLTNDELEKLIDLNDVAAMHVLGSKIRRDKNSLEKTEAILQKAMVYGSISAATALHATLYNMATHNKGLTEEQKQAMHAKSVFYDAFTEYRLGRLDLTQFDNPEARELEKFVIDLNQKRIELGLGEFQNFQYPAWPQGFRDKCDRLISEYNSNNQWDSDSH